MKIKLTELEKKEFSDWVVELGVSDVKKQLENLAKFSVGDVFTVNYSRSRFRSAAETFTVCNSYNVPKKYVVVHVEEGIPFAKVLSSAGKPYGVTMCMYMSPNLLVAFFDGVTEPEFILDPAHTEAIICAQEDDYDPTVNLREAKKLHKEIIEHNKKAKINTKNLKDLNNFLLGLSKGSVLWRSPKNNLTVISVERAKNSNRRWLKDKEVAVVKVKPNRGAEKTLFLEDVHSCALYTSQPRSFKEELKNRS